MDKADGAVQSANVGNCYIPLMATLSLSPHVLAWAAHKGGFSVEDLARKIAAPSKVESFTEGKLTPSQAKKVASVARIPFGYLFLSEPPELAYPKLPDLRQLPDAEPLSDGFYEVVSDVLRKQEWFTEYLQEAEVDRPSFVGRYAGREDNNLAELVAADITQTLQINTDLRKAQGTVEEYYSLVAERLEGVGVLVFKSSIVKGNTHWGLPATQFRGFALADPIAPVVFVNASDWPSAWVFTLLHEAAHLWLGYSGVSDVSPATSYGHAGVEALCNRIAAEVLTPVGEFIERWKSVDATHLVLLSRHFRVSQLVIARRALELKLITKQDYLLAAEAAKKAASAAGGGGDGISNIPVWNSKRFTKAVVAKAMTGELMLRDAGSLLNTTPYCVIQLGKRK